MEVTAADADPAGRPELRVLADVTQAIFAVSDQVLPTQQIGTGTWLIADLGLESIQIASLLFQLNTRYAGAVSFAEFVTGIMDGGSQPDATVGDLVAFIVGALHPGHEAGQASRS